MTDSAATIQAPYTYDPYGKRSKSQGDLESDFGFTGHYYQQNSALYLTLFRAYDPETCRWLSRDPIGEGGDLNLYSYVANNPVNYVDPLGLLVVIKTKDGTTISVWTAEQFINQVQAQPDGAIAHINFVGHGDPESQGLSEYSDTKESLMMTQNSPWNPMLNGPSIKNTFIPIKDVLKSKMMGNGTINLDGCGVGGKNKNHPGQPNLPSALSGVMPGVYITASTLSTGNIGPKNTQSHFGHVHWPFSIKTYFTSPNGLANVSAPFNIKHNAPAMYIP